MPYRLVTFDGLTLPTLYRDGDGLKSTAQIESDYVTLAGGRTWDARRTDRARPNLMRYQMDCVIVGTSLADLLSQETALKAKNGVYGTLTRQDYVPNSQTVLARMSVPETTEKAAIGPLWQPISLIFDMADWPWKGASQTSSTTSLGNAGNAPYTAVTWTITAGAGAPCTAVDFIAGPDSAGRIWHWHWTGTIAATKSLVIDCGAMTVKNDGADAYSTFALQASHNQNYWTEVPPSGLTYSLTLTGAGATHLAQSYDGWQS